MADQPHEWGPTKEADPEVKDIALKVKSQLEEKTGECFPEFAALKYRRAPYSKEGKPIEVGVIFYLIRVKIGPSRCCNIKVEVVVSAILPATLLAYQLDVDCDSSLEAKGESPLFMSLLFK